MLRTCSLLVAAAVLLTPLFAADSPPANSSKLSLPEVEKLIQQLGDANFQVRTNAQKSLEKADSSALPLLQEALKKATDPETKRRLEEMIPGLEHAAALGATRVTIAMKDRPIREVVNELAKQSGQKINLYPEANAKDERERRVITISVKDGTFWEALDQICAAGGLTFQEGWYGNGQDFLRLEFGESHPGFTYLDGPFRVTVRGLHYYRMVDFVTGMRNGQQDLGGIRKNEQLSLNLGVSVEPRLPLLSVGQVTIAEATDERGQNMAPPTSSNSHYYSHGSRSYMHHIQAQLSPALAGKKLKTLKGTIPVTIIAAQKPKIVIEKIMSVKDKTFTAGNTTIKIDQVTKNGQQIAIKMSLTETNRKVNGPDHSWMNTVTQRLELVDDKGNKYQDWGHSWSGGGNNNINGTFNFGSNGVAQLGDPVKLTYYDWTTIGHSVSFEFKDLPLP